MERQFEATLAPQLKATMKAAVFLKYEHYVALNTAIPLPDQMFPSLLIDL